MVEEEGAVVCWGVSSEPVEVRATGEAKPRKDEYGMEKSELPCKP